MHENISVLIVEDEEIWIRNLQLSLEDFGFEVVAIASTTADALQAFKNHHFDVALLDIQLDKQKSGIELGKLLHDTYKKPFIFITASQEGHAVKDAVEVHPSAYLIKPVNTSSLFIAIQNALYNFSNQHTATIAEGNDENLTSFFVKQGNRYKKIDWRDIVYLSSGKNYITVFNSADKTEYFIRSSLQNALQYILPKKLQSLFVQINRAEAIQLSFIEEMLGDEIRTAYKTFYISEAYHKDVKKRLNILS